MEIERKWLVTSWPEEGLSFPILKEESMRQGYISVHPTVRIREEAVRGGETSLILCFKSSGRSDGLSREEIEFPLTPEQFGQLEDLIGIPLIPKLRRTFLLPDGMHLEVNLVDQGMDTEYMYAEIEYETEEQARAWDPAAVGLDRYLVEEVTSRPDQTMGAYWEATRLKNEGPNPAD